MTENEEIDYAVNTHRKFFMLENGYLLAFVTNLENYLNNPNDLTDSEKIYWLEKIKEIYLKGNVNTEILKFLDTETFVRKEDKTLNLKGEQIH